MSIAATRPGADAAQTAGLSGVTRPAAAVVPRLGTGAAVGVRVVGNRLVDTAGQPVRLAGVSRSGTEYACVQRWGIFDGASDARSVAVMASWGINAVRIPLNEDCWLGINGVPAKFSGAAYRTAITSYVRLLDSAGMVAVLDLHWSAPGREPATGQQQMPDASHSVAFWRSVAATVRTDRNVVFDLFNEPYGVSWSCWRSGCRIPASGGHASWRAVGMQQLLGAVRGAGATQPVMLAGLAWAGDLSKWSAYVPHDPAHQLIASFHAYNFSGCNSAACWNRTVAPVAQHVPVVTGELGQNTCNAAFPERYMDWADAHGVSYLAWSWDTWGCPDGLIASYSGRPTKWGAAYRARLRQLEASTRAAGVR